MLDQQPVETLPVLGEEVSLADHMQVNFFDVEASPERELWVGVYGAGAGEAELAGAAGRLE